MVVKRLSLQVGLRFLLSVTLMVLMAGCGGGSGGGDDVTPSPPPVVDARAAAVAAINEVKAAQTDKAMAPEPFPYMIRTAANARVPAVANLVAQGPAAVDAILDEFRRPPNYSDAITLPLLAYVLERIGDKRAVPVLADWLDANLFRSLPGWSTDFVTHAIKVLQPQAGLNTTTQIYLIDEQFDTLLQARRPVAAAAPSAKALSLRATIQGVLNGDLTPEQKQACVKTVRVSGINAEGQQVSVDMPYKVVVRDVNDIVNDPQSPAALRDTIQRVTTSWAETDNTIYGSSDYVPGSNSKITDASNCGGRVAEKIVNQLTAALGLPLTLGSGGSDATKVRDFARTFGTEVGISEIDTYTVIAIGTDSHVAHVEVPISVSNSSAVIQSKWDQGMDRFHTVSTSRLNPLPNVVQFKASIDQVNGNSFFLGGAGVKFYRVDPSRIRSVVVDSSRCPCTPGDPAGIPVQFSRPTQSEVGDRVITVSGSVGNGASSTPIVSGATLSVNGNPQNIAIVDGSFQAQVVLRSGDNEIRVSVEGLDGRRGCAVKQIKSTTPKTTLSATLTWSLGGTDVDLYVTQPDGETAWYGRKTTNASGRLDVDNTSGFGPENYFINLAATNPLVGSYAVRVHYFRDQEQSDTKPARTVTWRVVILLNEGTPNEKYEVHSGTLSSANPRNDTPGASGPDWATVKNVVVGGS